MTAVYPPHCPNLPIPQLVARAVMDLETERAPFCVYGALRVGG